MNNITQNRIINDIINLFMPNNLNVLERQDYFGHAGVSLKNIFEKHLPDQDEIQMLEEIGGLYHISIHTYEPNEFDCVFHSYELRKGAPKQSFIGRGSTVRQAVRAAYLERSWRLSI